MGQEFSGEVIEQDGERHVGWSPEISGANGQRRTIEECRASIDAANPLIQIENWRKYTSR